MKKHPKYNVFVTEDGSIFGPTGKKRKCRFDKDGYFRLNITHESKHLTVLVHRLVAETYLGNKKLNMTVNHKDLNKQNNAVENLEYITMADNTRHAFRNGAIKKCMPVVVNGVLFYSKREAERVTGINRFSL